MFQFFAVYTVKGNLSRSRKLTHRPLT